MKTKTLALGALFCGLTAVAAQLIIPIQPVPFSFAMTAVYLTGALLDRRTAFWSQAAYLLLGAAGAPVFSGFMGGAGKLLGPTGGYLITYPLMAYLIALLAEKWGRGFVKYTLSMTLALIVCYAGGSAWLAFSTGNSFAQALAVGAAPFLALDAVKVVFTAWFAAALQRALNRARIISYAAGGGT